MKQINSLKHAAASLTSLAALLVLTLALALSLLVSSCQAEDDPAGGPDGFTVEITTLSGVAIEPMDGAATAQQQNYPNSPSKLEGVPPCGAGACDSRTATTTRASATTRATSEDPLTGYTGCVKTRFVPGDVLHILVAPDATPQAAIQYSTATLTDPGTGAAPVWTLSPPLHLPANPSDVYAINIFYDGKDTPYTTPDAYNAARDLAATPDIDPDTHVGIYGDFLHGVYNNFGGGNISDHHGITFTPDGQLTLCLPHSHALVRIPAIDNQTGFDITSIHALLIDAQGDPVSGHTPTSASAEDTPATAGIPLQPEDADALSAPCQAICGVSNNNGGINLQSFLVRLTDGRTLTVPVPDADANGNPNNYGHGRTLNPARHYRYRLTLLPGSATATALTDGSDTQPWTDRADPAVPDGYIPIYTTSDLRKIGRPLRNPQTGEILPDPDAPDGRPLYAPATFGSYTYTADRTPTGTPLRFSLGARYILMADIDLTPADPTNPAADELWPPIGVDPDKLATDPNAPTAFFTGHLNGNGHRITGLTVKTASRFAGLIAYTKGAVIYNLHLQDARVESTYNDNRAINAGALIGYSDGSTLALCSATRSTITVTGKDNGSVGSLVGSADNGTLTRCYATACTAQSKYNSGGLMGMSNNLSTLVACYTAGCTVQADGGYAGGLMGTSSDGISYGCYAANVTITGNSSIPGALIGYSAVSAVVSCYATNADATSTTRLIHSGPISSTSGKLSHASVSPLLQGPTATDRDGSDAFFRNLPSGYSRLTYATDLATLTTDANTRGNNGSSFYDNFHGRFRDTDAALLSVPTVLANPDGSLRVEPRTWSVTGIWGDNLPTTEAEGSQVAAQIVWGYEGE